MIAFDNKTLNTCPDAKAGDRFICARCCKMHTLQDSEPPGLLWYECGGRAYLGGIEGKFIVDAEPYKIEGI